MSDWRAEIRKRLARAKLEPTRETEIVEEIVQHLEDRYTDLVARGADPADADAAVLAELDAEDVLPRRLRGIMPRAGQPPVPGAPRKNLLADLANDARYAARSLRKSPAFTLVTLLSLALGIGANTAIFQMLETLHLRTLPLPDAQDLAIVKIKDRTWGSGWFNGTHPDLTYKLWEKIRERQEGFAGTLAWGDRTVNLAASGVAEWARAQLVSGDYFQVLGVHPLLGRSFTEKDDRRGCTDPGAVLSHGFWQRKFGGDASALGRKLTVEGHSVTVIGVTPPSFFGLEVGRSFDLALPLCMEETLHGEQSMLDVPYGWWLSVVGRLKPGWTLERAGAQIEAASKGIFDETVPPGYTPDKQDKYKQYRLSAYPAGAGISELRDDYSKPLYFLLAIAALVLLIACANLANLLLARASAREREISIRLAIGASRGRLIRQLMAESLLIALLGAVLGLVVARVLTQFLVAFLSTPNNELFVNLSLDWRVLAFTAGAATLTCLLFGLAPALRASRTDVGTVLKAAGHATTASRERFGLRRLLVVVQVALSFVLLFGALLFVRSLRNLVTLDPGFRDDGVLVLSFDARPLDLSKERRVPFVRDLLARLRNTSGIEGAASVSIVPISGNGWNNHVRPDGADRSKEFDCKFDRVSGGYFHTLGAQIVAGRDFTDADTLESPLVAIVSEQFVQKLGENPGAAVGRRFRVESGPRGGDEPVYEIIGVVRDMKYRSLREEFPATAFVPLAQDKDPFPFGDLVIRSDLPAAGVVGSLKHAVADFEPRLVIDFDLLDRIIDESVLQERLMATLAGFFGLLASLLAVIGLYGVVSYSVARRVHEIGIRMALGADAGKVSRMVVREAVELLVVGLAAGVVLALLAARAAAALLYGLAPHDPTTIAMAVVLMATVTILASLLPARRAARVDPMVALREE